MQHATRDKNSPTRVRGLFLMLVGLTFVALCMAAQAQTTARGTAFGTIQATTPGTTRLAGGLKVQVRLGQAINSKTAAEGDQWDGVLATDLIVAGHLRTPAGTQVTGIVSKAVSAARAQGNGILELKLTSIHGTGVTSDPLLRQGVNPALSNTGTVAAAGIPGEATVTANNARMSPDGTVQNNQQTNEARFPAGSILGFTTE